MAKNRIKELRKSQNITLENLVSKLKDKNIKSTTSQLSKYENGSRMPRNDDIWLALAEILGVSVQYLRGYTMYKGDEDFVQDLQKGKLQLTGLEWHNMIGQDNLNDFQNLLVNLSQEQRINILSLLEPLMIAYSNSTYEEEDFIYIKIIFRKIAEMSENKAKISDDTQDNRMKSLGGITKAVIDYLDNVQAYPDDYFDND